MTNDKPKNDISEPPFPTPTDPIYDERVYCRDDRQLIAKALQGEKRPCMIFYGLRRYGKTCFLHRIERVCNQGLLDYPAGKYRAHMLITTDGARVNADKLGKILDAFEDGDVPDMTLVLIDDLQHISVYMDSEPDGVDAFATQVGNLIRLASKDKRLRLVLCEPTNFGEWLDGIVKGVGPKFKPFLAPFDMLADDCILPPLNRKEAYKLLSAAVDGTPRVTGIEPRLSDHLRDSFGGNPWLLIYAHQVICETGWKTFSKCSAITSKVKQSIDIAANEERLASIYGSLSRAQRFYVRLVFDAERGGHETKRWLNEAHEYALTDEGDNIGTIMPMFGLVNAKPGGEPKLIPLMRHYLAKEMPAYSTFKTLHREDRDVWGDVLTVAPPTDSTRPFIIHQLSDLMLNEETAQTGPWQAYLKRLGELKAEAIAKPDQATWPDLIVICGNTIVPPRFDESDPDASEDAYQFALTAARAELVKLCEYLRPQNNAEDADLRQIIIVPGVFDLDWRQSSSGSRAAHAQKWRSEFKEFSGTSTPYQSDWFDIRILPFDTVSLDGAYRHGRNVAVKNLAAVRHQLQHVFAEDLEVLMWAQDDEKGKIEKNTAATRLDTWTMNYVVDKSDELKNDDIDPTFHFRESSPAREKSGDDEVPASFVADTGYISAEQCGWLEDIASDLNSGSPDHNRLTIAVTHHHPHLRRRAGVLEFYDGLTFRELLVKAGVQYVLHGHCESQQVLSEKVTLKDGASGRQASRTIELIGSGAFSELRGKIDANLPDHNRPYSAAPSFNEIVVSRSGIAGEPPRVVIHFTEWDGKKLVKRGTVPPSSRLP